MKEITTQNGAKLQWHLVKMILDPQILEIVENSLDPWEETSEQEIFEKYNEVNIVLYGVPHPLATMREEDLE